MTGFAPAIDDDGNLFVATGNGDFSPPDDYGESILKLDGKTLKVLDYFRPSDYSALPRHEDFDLGSGGITLFSAAFSGSTKKLAAVIGKVPVLYLLNQENLGKNQTNDSGALQALHVKPCTVSAQCRGAYGGVALSRSQSDFLV